MLETTDNVTPWISPVKFIALVVGVILTPIAIGLSLQLLPIGAPLLLYAIIGGIFAYLKPVQSWQWGFWTAGGMLIAIASVQLFAPMLSGGRIELAFNEFTRITLLMGFLPALLGGCAGGLTGRDLAHSNYKRAGGIIGLILTIAIVLIMTEFNTVLS